MKDLLERREALLKQLNAVNAEILKYEDGLQYAVVVHSYGNHLKHNFNNLESALELCSEYYQDNGYAHLYTTKPGVTMSLQSGDVYYVKDISIVDAYRHPVEAVKVSTGYWDYYEQEEYNGDESDNFLQ